MDHALLGDASKGPGQDHHIEGGLAIGELLSRTDAKANVSYTGLAGVLPRRCDRLWIRIDAVHSRRERRDPKREAAVATPEIEDALPSDETFAAPLAELAQGVWAK